MKAWTAALAALLIAGAAAASELPDAPYHAQYAQVLDELSAGAAQGGSRIKRMIGFLGAGRGARDPEQVLERLLQAHWEWMMRISPEWATFVGYPGQSARWSDPRVAAVDAFQALQKRTLDVARSIDREALSPAQQLNLDLFLYETEIDVAGHDFPGELLQVNPMYGIHSGLAHALDAMPLFNAGQLDDYLNRLQGISDKLAGGTQNLRQGLEQGVTWPRVTLDKVPDQVDGLMPARDEDSPLLKPLDKLPPELAASGKARALEIFRQQVKPALREFAAFLREEYIPGAVEATGLNQLPQGEAWYAWRVRKMTTTDLSPQQIHELGLAEVERIRQEMYAVMREAGYDKQDIRGFARHLARDQRQFYTDGDSMVRDYRALAKQADAALVKLFGRYPTLPYGIEAIPAHEASGRSGAYYLRGSAENGRPGIFRVNTARLAESPRYEMEALLLHEAVPGHHFQLALTQELEGLPAFRRHGGFTAYIEGWGLYAESLGEEMGFYQTPADRFGALTFEMWRAIRLVVDTGMHALGWSRQQAMDFFEANTGRGPVRIEAEVNRYLVMPGQALAYKIGQLKITELRARARAALGDAFDIRRFHDFVLSEGALPLKVLEARVDRWIQENKHAQAPETHDDESGNTSDRKP